jgi:addiction module HigA family antidote
MKKLPPLHPGEVLREEYMAPLGLTAYALAQRIGVPRQRVERLKREEKGISADTALRLGAYFHTTPEFWLNLQTKFELETRLRDRKIARKIHEIEMVALPQPCAS